MSRGGICISFHEDFVAGRAHALLLVRFRLLLLALFRRMLERQLAAPHVAASAGGAQHATAVPTVVAARAERAELLTALHAAVALLIGHPHGRVGHFAQKHLEHRLVHLIEDHLATFVLEVEPGAVAHEPTRDLEQALIQRHMQRGGLVHGRVRVRMVLQKDLRERRVVACDREDVDAQRRLVAHVEEVDVCAGLEQHLGHAAGLGGRQMQRCVAAVVGHIHDRTTQLRHEQRLHHAQVAAADRKVKRRLAEHWIAAQDVGTRLDD